MISIITPSFNCVKYIEDCIKSVVLQDYAGVEHVIVDGGSTDGTLEIIKKYKESFSDKINYISEPDKGACDAWNKGLKLARGDIFGWLGADDKFEPEAFTAVIDFFENHPNEFFVFGECNIINETGNIIGRYASNDYAIENQTNLGRGIPTMAAFYKRELVEKIGLMDTTINLCDCDYWVRTAKRYKINRMNKILSNFRVHSDSVTIRKQNSVYIKEDYIINRRYGGDFFSPVCLRYYKYLLSKLFCADFFSNFFMFRRVKRNLHDMKKIRSIVIFGAALTGNKCFDYLKNMNIDVLCFIDNFPPPDNEYLGLPVLKPDEFMQKYSANADAVIIASNGRNSEIRRQIKSIGFKKKVIEFQNLMAGNL